ncbi:MAG: hypothetical protein AAF384_18880 [Pseudomonadota bacterium]
MERVASTGSQAAIAELIAHRYGDGLVYVPRTVRNGTFRDAINQGFISEDGFVTRKGRRLLARLSA